MSEERSIEFRGTGLQALGWGLVSGLSILLIIPAAWGAAAMYRWFVGSLSFSDGTYASFEGRGSEVWGYFAIAALLVFSGQVSRVVEDPEVALLVSVGLPMLLLPISAAIWLQIVRWFFSSVWLSCDTKLSFEGRYGPYLGWMFLVSLSVFTIIGWAWALVAFVRWVCRNVDAGSNRLLFVGSGWGLLWRCFLAGLASLFLIPIPWVAVWICKWFARNMLIRKETA